MPSNIIKIKIFFTVFGGRGNERVYYIIHTSVCFDKFQKRNFIIIEKYSSGSLEQENYLESLQKNTSDLWALLLCNSCSETN